MTLESPVLAERAAAEALQAADKAAVSVRLLAGPDECAAGSAVLARIWGTAPESAPLTGDALTSIGHAGGCVLGAFDGEQLIGVTVGLAGAPWATELYSMIAGVAAGHTRRGVGLALKFGQRAWALDHGATSMVWTFDPLIRRNAHFNLNRLGARAGEYLPDFYPPMHDERNRADLTDRLVAVWDLANPPGPAEPAGEGALLVATPPDIEEVRRRDPALARRWRMQIRTVMASALGDGYRITGFTGDGAYVLERQP